MAWMGPRVEFWWAAEKASGRLWDRVCRDGVSCWLDWLPAFCFVRRKNAERRRWERIHGEPL